MGKKKELSLLDKLNAYLNYSRRRREIEFPQLYRKKKKLNKVT